MGTGGEPMEHENERAHARGAPPFHSGAAREERWPVPTVVASRKATWRWVPRIALHPAGVASGSIFPLFADCLG